jgi:hypothetical protein
VAAIRLEVAMNHVRVSYRFADGDEIECEVYAETSYPDALGDARAEAMRGFREAFGYCVAELTKGEDE